MHRGRVGRGRRPPSDGGVELPEGTRTGTDRSSACHAGLRALCVAATLTLATTLVPTIARASRAHGFQSAFGQPGEAAGQLALVAGAAKAAGSGVAVDAETHDVYVADTANNRIAEFTQTGGFVRAWGWGVQNGAQELQSCTTTCRKGLSGFAPGELEAPALVAIDNDPTSPSYGDLYVGDAGQELESPRNLVTKFTGEGALVETWGEDGQVRGSGAAGGAFGGLTGVAVDGAGNAWVLTFGTLETPVERLFEFSPEGGLEKECAVESGDFAPQGLAVDGAGHFYFTQNAETVHRFTCANAKGEGTVDEAPISGFAIDSSQGDLYVDAGGSEILDIPSACVPSNRACEPIDAFGKPQLSGAAGVAVDPSTGIVYAANASADQVAAFGVVVEATTLAAEDVTATGATLRGQVNPDGAELTRCRFEYGEGGAAGGSVPCEESAGQIGSGRSPVEVHARIAGLSSGTAYDFRLRASNGAGHIVGEGVAFTTLPTAVVEEADATQVEPTSALLGARINPEGMSTTYRFEYDTRPYEEGEPPHGTSVPDPDAGIGSGQSGVTVTQPITGLTPNTTYYFRVVATDANGVALGPTHSFIDLTAGAVPSCENEALRRESDTDPATGLPLSTELPDCRAYELVSPAAKNAAFIAPILNGLGPALADDGDRLIVSSIQCFASSQSCTGDRASKGPPFEFSRSSVGWQTTPLAPSGDLFEVNSVWGYDADTGMVLDSSPIASHVTDELYARHPDGTLEGIGPIAEDANYSAIEAGDTPVATADLSHVVLESGGISLWPSFDASHGGSLYEYANLGNTAPLLVAVTGGYGSTDLISACGAALGTSKTLVASEALSDDGRIVYFTAAACEGGSGTNEHTRVPVEEPYARVDGELADAHTVAIAQPQCGAGSQRGEAECRAAEAHPAAGILEGVSEDGSQAVFSSYQQLTDDATEGSRNLYVYDLTRPAGQRLVDLSAGDSSGLGPQVQGTMALSADGSHVYFVARGVLSAGKNAAGKEPVEGADNLYVYSGGRTRFVVTLPGDSLYSLEGEQSEPEQWAARGGPTANVTPDGRFLAFASHGALTPDTTRRLAPMQLFRYDAETEQLKRVSIGERGFDDNGNESVSEARLVRPISNVGPIRRDPSMSDDGSFIFFQSAAALTPRALNDVSVNGRAGSANLAQNIYEWEVDGDGGCEQESGCVHLISDGVDASEGHGGRSSVELLGADTTGENVFFATADPLVEQDNESQADIYDARVNGGFPAPTLTPGCEEPCRSELPPPPVFGALGTSTFSGAGNLLGAGGTTTTNPTPPTRAELLARALKSCRTKDAHRKRRRTSCERQARTKYGVKQKKKKKKKKSNAATRNGRHRSERRGRR
jgi:DNA-binding beta-propeller fold protein YncE